MEGLAWRRERGRWIYGAFDGRVLSSLSVIYVAGVRYEIFIHVLMGVLEMRGGGGGGGPTLHLYTVITGR